MRMHTHTYTRTLAQQWRAECITLKKVWKKKLSLSITLWIRVCAQRFFSVDTNLYKRTNVTFTQVGYTSERKGQGLKAKFVTSLERLNVYTLIRLVNWKWRFLYSNLLQNN